MNFASSKIASKSATILLAALFSLFLGALALTGCSSDALKTTAESQASNQQVANNASNSENADKSNQEKGSDDPKSEEAVKAEGGAATEADQVPSSSGSIAEGSSPSSEAAPAPSSPTPAVTPEPTPEPAPAPSTITVSVTIDSSRAGAKAVGGVSTSVTLPAGATAYDALCATGAGVSGSSTYVRGINGLSEFDCGSGSGWMYSVNGSFPNVACGRYTLSGGESVLWVYTCNMGKDL